jgi:hypothetical protein
MERQYELIEGLNLIKEDLEKRVEGTSPSDIKSYAEDLVAGLPSSVKGELLEELIECESKDDVDRRYAKLRKLMTSSSSRLPLPVVTETKPSNGNRVTPLVEEDLGGSAKALHSSQAILEAAGLR